MNLRVRSPLTSLLLLLVLKPTHREPVDTAPFCVALSRGSVYKPQNCARGSTCGNGGVVPSRHDLHRIEIYWLPPVDSRKACVYIIIFFPSGSRHLTDS